MASSASRASNLRLMYVLAHPDDESLGAGGTLAKYADAGIETYVVTATRGERGRHDVGLDARIRVLRERPSGPQRFIVWVCEHIHQPEIGSPRSAGSHA